MEKVVLKRDNDQVTMRIVWRGGDVTQVMVPITGGRFEQISDFKQIEHIILTMAQHGHSDKQISTHVTEAGLCSSRCNIVIPSMVTCGRNLNGIFHIESNPGPIPIDECLRPHQLAKRLQMKPHWIYDRIRNVTIQVAKQATHNAHLFPIQPITIEQFKKLIRGKVITLTF